MTYKELVNAIREIANNHYMIKEFGYGDLSDIKANIDSQTTDYPYLFLNPQSHTRTERTVTYRFNMIMMEMSLNEDNLTTQSDCAQYIDDVLAELKYNYAHEFDLNINFNLTPFNERFQDVVAGMTCDISIEVPQKLNLCEAPFQPAPPTETVIYEIEEIAPYSFFTQIGVFGGPSPNTSATIINTDYLTEAGSDLDVNILNPIRARIRFEATVKNLIDQATIDAEGPGVFDNPPPAMYLQTGWVAGQTLVLHHADPWDFTKAIDEEYTIVNEFEIDLAADRYRYQFDASPFDTAIENVARYSRVKYTITLI